MASRLLRLGRWGQGYAPRRSRRVAEDTVEVGMSSDEEIRPRELKPALLELDGISRASVEAHYKLYQGYVNKRNEILGKLGSADLGAANQISSEVRALKVELSFALGGIKNH